jgi:hypothetical protein
LYFPVVKETRGKDKETTAKDKETRNDLQITTQKVNEETTRTPLKLGGELGAKEGLVFPAPATV